MTQVEIQELADRIASILLSHAAHGLATTTLLGSGEITIRDSLIAAAAAQGASSNTAWIFDREHTPAGWTDSAVDLVIIKTSNKGNESNVGGIELKWWRQTDAGNASNRRRDLIKDFLRAAALYVNVNDFAFVALLSTDVSWSATATTTGSDSVVMTKLSATTSQNWNTTNLITSKAVKNSVIYLAAKVPIVNIFHTKLLSNHSLAFASGSMAFARVWSVKKLQNSKVLDKKQVAALCI